MTHTISVDSPNALATVPVPRAEAAEWPGSGAVAFVPAVLLLAARGRCSCTDCVDGFVRLLARQRLQLL